MAEKKKKRQPVGRKKKKWVHNDSKKDGNVLIEINVTIHRPEKKKKNPEEDESIRAWKEIRIWNTKFVIKEYSVW